MIWPGRTLLVAAVAVALVAGPRAGAAWDFDAHRAIVARAIELLPGALRPFYDRHRSFVVEHSVDPDLWRRAGFEEEGPRHFLDLDAYGAYPFAALPRDYDDAVRRFGRETVHQRGLLPWRAEEVFGRLVDAFARLKREHPAQAGIDVQFFSAVLAHYVSDAFVPLHATVNSDGQLTGQQGLHGRFEAELFDRYHDRLTLAAPRMTLTGSVGDFIFETLAEGTQLVGPVLEADRAARAGRPGYDDLYYDRFFARVRPVFERRLAESAAAVAAFFTAAWDRGGRPQLH